MVLFCGNLLQSRKTYAILATGFFRFHFLLRRLSAQMRCICLSNPAWSVVRRYCVSILAFAFAIVLKESCLEPLFVPSAGDVDRLTCASCPETYIAVDRARGTGTKSRTWRGRQLRRTKYSVSLTASSSRPTVVDEIGHEVVLDRPCGRPHRIEPRTGGSSQTWACPSAPGHGHNSVPPPPSDARPRSA